MRPADVRCVDGIMRLLCQLCYARHVERTSGISRYAVEPSMAPRFGPPLDPRVLRFTSRSLALTLQIPRSSHGNPRNLAGPPAGDPAPVSYTRRIMYSPPPPQPLQHVLP